MDSEEFGGLAALPVAGFEDFPEEDWFEAIEEFYVNARGGGVWVAESGIEPVFEGLLDRWGGSASDRRGSDQDGRGKVFGTEFAIAGEDGGGFEGLQKFADVASPGALEEFGFKFGSDASGEGLSQDASEQVTGEAGDVFRAVAQGGEIDLEGAEAEEEIRTEFATGDELLEGAMSGGDEAEISGARAGVADGGVFLAFNDAEEFHLDRGGDVADFVEEDGAALGMLEEAGAVGVGTGEGTADVAEEFAFHQLRAEGGQVNGNEWFAGAGRVLMDGFGDEFLACAAFAGDENSGFGFSDEGDPFEDGLHRWGLADKLRAGELAGGGWRGGFRLVEDAVHEMGGGIEIEGFGEVFDSSALYGADGGFQGAEGGHDDDGDPVVMRTETFEEGEAVDAGESDIKEDDIGLVVFDGAEGFVGVGSDGDGVAFVGEVVPEGPADQGFIIDD